MTTCHLILTATSYPSQALIAGSAFSSHNPRFLRKRSLSLFAYLKANPGKVTMASAGVGSSQQLYGELFMSMVGVKMLHVPYRGGGPALADLLGGHVQVIFDTLPTLIELIRAGKLRALGVTSAKRSDVFPNVPAIGEFVPGYEADGWQGIGVPRNTPTEIINKLSNEINATLAEPPVNSKILAGGYSVFVSSPVEFRKFVADYTAKWAKVIRGAGIKAQ
jgi:tripartite-type tricarboxylate transporter receptor subunit TctC